MNKKIKNISPEELVAYTGDSDRYIDVRRCELTEGRGKGMSIIDITTMNGLRISLLPDRGLDIFQISYKGYNLSFVSKNGPVNSANAEKTSEGFGSYFIGGMLTTCGLRNCGATCVDVDGSTHFTHGKFSLLPADNVSIIRPQMHRVIVRGTIRETKLFEYNLKVKREIEIDAIGKTIGVHDTLINESDRDEEIMLLYHYNFGFPFLMEGCKVVFQQDDIVKPRDAEAEKGLKEYKNIIAPVLGYQEQVFYHEQQSNEQGFAKVAVTNDELKIKAELLYKTDTLPHLIQWKSMKFTDYALGLEPALNYVMGRKVERENNGLKKIKPLEKMEFSTKLVIEDIV